MNDLTVTVTGWVATDAKLHVTPGRADFVSFRLASTSRYFDRANSAWVDRDTEWFSVRVFRAAATFVSESIHKGQPVIVSGRLHTNVWDAESGPRTDLVIDAHAVGHDLTKGVARFTRAVVEAAEQTAAEQATEADAVEDDSEVAAEEAQELALEPAPF